MPGTLFITRKYPPSVGGIQTLEADVWASLGADPDAGALLIAHGGTNRWPSLWFLGVTLRTIWLVLRGKVDIVLTGDLATFWLLAPVLRALRVRHATMAMGTDIVRANRSYPRAARAGIGKAPLVLATSRATAEVAISRGAARERVRVVRLGVRDPHVSEADRRAARTGLRERFSIHSSDVTLLTLGRLVQRKGVEWFIREVLPKVPDGVVYLVAGVGEDGVRIDAAVAALPDPPRVRVLGAVSSEDCELLMRGADLFIAPNVAVVGDPEGFGLVAVEAALRGALVVAADLEGLRDAVDDGSTGYLVPSEDSEAWAAQIRVLLEDGPLRDQTARAFSDAARARYSTMTMGRELRRLLALESAVR